MKTKAEAIALFMQVAEFGGEKQEIIGGYQVCEPAAKLPLMSDEEFMELQESILKHGLQEKIELNEEEKVLDGRNRLLACLACDVEPEFKYKESFLEDVDQVEVKNLRRRHLAAGIRAMAYLRLHGQPVDDAEETVEEEIETQDDATEEPVVVVQKPVAKPADPIADKKRVDAAREAGVSVRAMQQAVNVTKHAVPEVQDAVATGKMTLAAGEVVSTLPEDEQLEVVSSKDEAEIAKAAKEKERELRQQANWRTFDLAKWMPSFDKKVSKMLAAVPPDLRDRCHRHMAETLGSTVRVEKETEDLLNAESIIPYMEDIIAGLPKSERAPCELAIANRYASVVRAKDCDAALAAINAVIEGLSEAQKKKVDAALRKQYAPAPTVDEKPARKAKTPDVPVKPTAEKTRHTS
jgi:hypothetical protein